MDGRGKWTRRNAKATTEQYPILHAHKLMRDDGLRLGAEGVFRWTDPRTGESRVIADFSSDVGDSDDGSLTLTLRYRAAGVGDAAVSIAIDATLPHIGGRRWWFFCPHCGQRRSQLYLRRGVFRCRVCHGLTYRSCQRAHHVEREIRREEREQRRLDRMFEQLSAESQAQLAPFVPCSSLRAYARESR